MGCSIAVGQRLALAVARGWSGGGRRWLALLLWALLCAISTTGHAAERPTYKLGVFPYLPATTVDRVFGPVASALGRALDARILLRTKPTFEKFADELAQGSYDIVFVHPFLLIDAVDRHGYVPLARLDGELRSLFMVRSASPAQALSDLAGQPIGLPSPLTAASEMLEAELADAGLQTLVHLVRFPSHTSCLNAVLALRVAACGTPAFSLNRLPEAEQRQLRALHQSAPLPSLAFAVHGRVPAAIQARLRDGILRWQPPAQGGGTLALGAGQKGFVPVAADDYAAVRALRARLQRPGPDLAG